MYTSYAIFVLDYLRDTEKKRFLKKNYTFTAST